MYYFINNKYFIPTLSLLNCYEFIVNATEQLCCKLLLSVEFVFYCNGCCCSENHIMKLLVHVLRKWTGQINRDIRQLNVVSFILNSFVYVKVYFYNHIPQL